MLKDTIESNKNNKVNSREIRLLKKYIPAYFSEDGKFLKEKFDEMLEEEEMEIEKESYNLNFLGKSYARFETGLDTETVITPNTEYNKKNKNSENIYIVGDNVDALKHLVNSYHNEIPFIYIDPPYNTGFDGFEYPDNFKFDKKTLSEKVGITEEEAERVLELEGKSTHSAWLTFMYSRLALAWDLLTDDGIMFITIDDNEQSNLRAMCDEIFGEHNFIAQMVWSLPRGINAGFVAKSHEYVLTYAKNVNKLKPFKPLDGERISVERINKKIDRRHPESVVKLPKGFPYEGKDQILSGETGGAENVTFIDDLILKDGKLQKDARLSAGWTMKNMLLKWINGEDVTDTKGQVVRRFFLKENGKIYSEKILDTFSMKSIITGAGDSQVGREELEELLGSQDYFSYPKPTELIKRLIKITTDKNATILDFFSGSATTAHAVMKANDEDEGNRKYIMVQIPEEIEKDHPAYEAGYKTIDELAIKRIEQAAKTFQNENLDLGFKIFKLNEVTEETLMDVADFNPESYRLLSTDFITPFEFGGESGKTSILTTWLNRDGYGLMAETQQYLLKDYKADLCENSLYIIDEGLQSEDIMVLIKRIETNELLINRIVVYAHSLSFDMLHELKTNISNLKNNSSISVIERY